MATITCDFPPSAFSALRMSPKELARELRLAACVQWYAQGILSQGKAAEIAGMTRSEFLMELSRRGVPISQVDEEELERELDYIRAHRR